MSDIRFVYCIGSQLGNPVKIGLTGDPIGRLSNIQAHNWQPMRLFWAVWGTRKNEHQMLNTGNRIRGEWLRDPYGIIANKFESDLLIGAFAGPLSPLLGSMQGASIQQIGWPLLKGRDLNAIARATCIPSRLKPLLVEYCLDRSLDVPDIPDVPARDFSLAEAEHATNREDAA